MDNIFDNDVILDKLPTEKGKLEDLLLEVNSKMRVYRDIFFNEE